MPLAFVSDGPRRKRISTATGFFNIVFKDAAAGLAPTALLLLLLLVLGVSYFVISSALVVVVVVVVVKV